MLEKRKYASNAWLNRKPGVARGSYVRMYAASLSFRDQVAAQGMYAGSPKSARSILLSDDAGDEVETGYGAPATGESSNE